MQAPRPLFSCSDLSVEVPGRRLVDALSLSVQRGEVLAILGRNGCGKTLALHTLAGLRAAAEGAIRLLTTAGEIDVARARRSMLARHLGLLPQHSDDLFPATVLETVLIGRHPHIGRFGWETTADLEAARAALARVGLAGFADRDVMTLSGGERRRVAIAQLLAQETSLLLLDEPTNHLDPQHQVDVLALCRERAADGAAIVAALHDVNLAVRFADRCLLLYGDGSWDLDTTADVLSADRLEKLYGTRMEAVAWRQHHLFVASADVPLE